MSTKIKEMCEALTVEIQNSYEQGITMNEAERLAGKFLHAQLLVTEELKTLDLNSRMRKSGLKTVKATIYLDEATKTDKKPSDVMLGAKVDSNEYVQKAQDEFDTAEVERDALQNYLGIFKEAHLHFRAIAKGKFE